MALIKSKELQNGISVEYWRINNARLNYDTNKVELNIGGYINKDIRLAGHNVVDVTRPELIDISDAPIEVRDYFYSKLKESQLDSEGNETNFFVDAIDDL